MTPRLLQWLIVWLGLCLVSQPAFAQSRGKRGSKRSASRSSAPENSSTGSASSSSASSSDDDLGDLDITGDAAPKPAPQRSAPEPVVKEPPPQAAPETPAEQEPALETSGEPDSTPAQPDEPALESAGPGLRADVFAGAGIGTRAFQRPSAVGGQVLDDQLFPAVEVGLEMRAWPDEAFSLYFLLHYQTSLGLVVEEQPLFALPNRVDVRSDRTELSCAPVVRLGSSALAPRLAFPIGVALRTFWPVLHNLMTPRYTLWGPQLRIELHVPITSALSIRLGPEAQWVAHYSSTLTDSGVESMGVALGVVASVRLALASIFALEISYRQSTAMASVAYGPAFRDIERYLSARLIGTM